MAEGYAPFIADAKGRAANCNADARDLWNGTAEGEAASELLAAAAGLLYRVAALLEGR